MVSFHGANNWKKGTSLFGHVPPVKDRFYEGRDACTGPFLRVEPDLPEARERAKIGSGYLLDNEYRLPTLAGKEAFFGEKSERKAT